MIEPAEHPVLVSLRQGRRVGRSRSSATEAGWRGGRVGPGQSVQPILGSDGGVGGCGGLVRRHRRLPAVRPTRLREEEEFPPCPARHPRRGHRGLRRPGADDDLQPAARRLHGPTTTPSRWGGSREPDAPAHRREPHEPKEVPLLLAMSGKRLSAWRSCSSPDREQRKVSVNGQALVDEDGWKLVPSWPCTMGTREAGRGAPRRPRPHDALTDWPTDAAGRPDAGGRGPTPPRSCGWATDPDSGGDYRVRPEVPRGAAV